MATFSIGEAVRSGFDLIRRNPKAVTAWGVLYFAVALGPSILVAILIPQSVEGGAGIGLTMTAQILSNLGTLASCLLVAILTAAVCRAILQPDERSRAYLRLGAQELWVGLVWFVIAIGLVILGVLLLGPVLFAVIAAYAGGGPWSVGGVILVALWTVAALALLIWLGVRFSLAAPMSFDRRAFLLLESWSLTRGRAWRIFLAYAGAHAILCALQLFALVAFVVVAAGIALLYGLASGTGFDEVIGDLPAGFLMLVAPLAFALLAALSAVVYPIGIAPTVTIYRRLSEEEASAPA